MSHTTKSVLDLIIVCPVCHTSYIPQNDEVCNCPAEETYVDYEDTLNPLAEAHRQ